MWVVSSNYSPWTGPRLVGVEGTPLGSWSSLPGYVCGW